MPTCCSGYGEDAIASYSLTFHLQMDSSHFTLYFSLNIMNPDTILRLRSLPIESVAERLGLRVARHKSLCPFHDDHHASLTFNTRRNTYRCFACDAHGGTIDLVMNRLHKSFPDACRWLADASNIIVEEYTPLTSTLKNQNSTFKTQNSFDPSRYARHFEHPWLSDEARTFLFDERRLDPRVVRWCRLTSWTDRQGTHWLQTPFFDQDGNLIGIQNRNLDYKKQTNENLVPTNTSPSNPQSHITPLPTGEGQGERLFRGGAGGRALEASAVPRFRFPYGSRCSIYNLPVLAMLRPKEPLYITEGCSDCWAMLSSGHKAVAIPSATLLSKADKDLLSNLSDRLGTTVHMYPDRDAPGERLFMQLKEVLPSLEHHQLPPGCKDYSEYYVKAT